MNPSIATNPSSTESGRTASAIRISLSIFAGAAILTVILLCGVLYAAHPRVLGIPTFYFIGYSLVALQLGRRFVPLPKEIILVAAIVSIYFVITLFRKPNAEAIIYYGMWMTNIVVFWSFYSLLQRQRLREIDLFFIWPLFGISIVGAVAYFLGLRDVGSIVDGLNINSYIFFLFLLMTYTLLRQRFAIFLVLVVVGATSHSRTFFVFLGAGLAAIAVVYVRERLFPRRLLFSLFLFFAVVGAASAIVIYFSWGRITDYLYAIELENFSKLNADIYRLKLFIEGIEILESNWLLGTGLGIENYRMGLGYESFGRSHNYYISYFGEFGLFFIPLTYYLVIRPTIRAFRSGSYAASLGIGVFFAIAFSEYVTSPFFWLVLAIIFHADSPVGRLAALWKITSLPVPHSAAPLAKGIQ